MIMSSLPRCCCRSYTYSIILYLFCFSQLLIFNQPFTKVKVDILFCLCIGFYVCVSTSRGGAQRHYRTGAFTFQCAEVSLSANNTLPKVMSRFCFVFTSKLNQSLMIRTKPMKNSNLMRREPNTAELNYSKLCKRRTFIDHLEKGRARERERQKIAFS